MLDGYEMKKSLIPMVVLLFAMAPATLAEPPVVPFPPVPAPRPVPPPPPSRPPTIFEFARTVKPLPGKYDVVLCHPYTGRPVRVCFQLPPGCVKVVVRKKLLCYEIDFDYGNFEIELNFGRRGRVRVDRN